MGAVYVDIGGLAPLVNGFEHHVGIDESDNQSAQEDDEQNYSGRSGFKQLAKQKYVENESKHNCHAPPATLAMDATVPPTFTMLSAMPAAPPKMACVMLGMNSILMMNATKTIKQGMRLAIHISIE